ncbi:MAG TPA: 50S ribosomal protein L6 [Candidatus Kapabacteria bacterium]|nr:50S ribosomal protein L6 [Candidatus Kapabacteria bacterium]
MSRIGKRPIDLPNGVTVNRDGNLVTVKGPKGELRTEVSTLVDVAVDGNQISVTRPSDQAPNRAAHGLTRTILSNMVQGVTDGFARKLEIVGVGYRAEMRGSILQLNLGYSHPIMFFPPGGIQIVAPTANSIVITGIDKQLVGQIAAKIRSFRPPEPYKGKGVKYENEQIRRKAGKSAGK